MTAATDLGTHPASRQGVTSRRFLSRFEPYFYAAPAIVLLVTVMMVPLVVGLTYTVRDIRILNPFSGGYVGFAHFEAVWHDQNFHNALYNTFWWTVSSLFFQFFLGLTLALLLNRTFPGRRIIQSLVFLPWAVPAFLSGLNWAWMFNPVISPLPQWLFALGILNEPTNILSDPDLAMWGPIVANIWFGIPFFAITLLAALQSIPGEIYEAASIDGASRKQQFVSITLPFLAPTIAITLMLRTIWIANFADLIIVMTNGGPADSTQIVSSYIFTQAFRRLDFGYASAIAAVLLVLLMAYAVSIIFIRRSLLRET
ncbi:MULTISPECIES: sugar ABC transporter permease [unclassified Pseudovibrio]|uniref:carbohydrate ABC transporter permease n=1 Tax=unclassified Pseudovibrio TaxID=2627060 RepID=UPI0007AEB6CF|nr:MULTISPECIES: sugar ABC transporter permease [unclassified Pseudovibrio]KZL03736.1 Trehalose transport system permease protein SugA [Pseudovibrio sp. W74]KZL09550.1 Trehalose transport system permease protein SugA [Pseudovibrio sp. Ad14]